MYDWRDHPDDAKAIRMAEAIVDVFEKEGSSAVEAIDAFAIVLGGMATQPGVRDAAKRFGVYTERLIEMSTTFIARRIEEMKREDVK